MKLFFFVNIFVISEISRSFYLTFGLQSKWFELWHINTHMHTENKLLFAYKSNLHVVLRTRNIPLLH